MRWCNVQTNEYDMQAITYPTIGTHHKLHNNDENKMVVSTISSNPDYHPIMQADPCVGSNAPSLGSSGEPGHPLHDIVFSWGGGGGGEASS